MDLFYSRRIGRPPSRSARVPTGGRLLDNPPATDIVGAAKLTGRTQRGTTLGLISAITAREFAAVADSNDVRTQNLVEPRAVYNVFRLKQDVLKNSSIGLIATHATRTGEFPATVGGVDWNLNFVNNMYNLSGQVAASRAGQSTRATGMGTEIRFSKFGGKHISGSVGYEGYSRQFRANDLGFVRRSHFHSLNGWINLRGNDPWRFTRRRNVNLNINTRWNTRGAKLNQNVNFNGNVQYTNYWFTGGGFGRSFSTQDDRETGGNGLVRIPDSYFGWFFVESDFRRRASGEAFSDFGQERDGKNFGTGIFARFQLASNIQVQFGPNYNITRNVTRSVANVVDSANGNANRAVFGKLDTDNFSLVTRASITFTKDLSFQLYNQLFFAYGDYRSFKALTSPTTFGPLMPELYTGNPDFNSRSMNVNAVLRWEYRPGSKLFLVWSQARSGSGTPGDGSFGRNLRGIFDAPGENVLLLKVNYWWNI